MRQAEAAVYITDCCLKPDYPQVTLSPVVIERYRRVVMNLNTSYLRRSKRNNRFRKD